MVLNIAVKTRHGFAGNRLRLAGWANDQAGPMLSPAEIILFYGAEPPIRLVQLAIIPMPARLTASVLDGSQHYYRLADATLRPLPAEARALTFARGDAYIAVSPGARLLADSPAIARFLHLRDDFNAERLAEALLDFLGQTSGQAEFPEAVTVLVVEAR
jgi:hypothetical protein